MTSALPGSAGAGKQHLRQHFLAIRRARSADALELARSAIRDHILARCRIEGWSCVAAYEPLRTEPGSALLLTALHEQGVTVLVPLTLADRDLDWVQRTPHGRSSPLGRTALSAAQAVLVPALAVALDGTRLGRGGGSYDRALGRCPDAVVVAALVFGDEIVAELPRDAWDRPVTAAVSPAGWTDLGRNTDIDPRR